MRHGVAYRKLGRKTAHRLATLRNLVTSLVLRDRIRTTLPAAKELRRWAEWVVTLAKTGTVRARRRTAEIVQNPEAVRKLFGPIAERYRERAGGYTRILRMGQRHGDAASMAMIEYVSAEAPAPASRKVKEKASTSAKGAAAREASAKKERAPRKIAAL
ncbi:MAG: 50S ribosomal protein L17 [Deltaproteobacteria bacterium]|nr:50S ribosomal protein L17 [Deltaproteobacteria bacterium]